jgi:hypothetical protein
MLLMRSSVIEIKIDVMVCELRVMSALSDDQLLGKADSRTRGKCDNVRVSGS